jgi:hypothetical protein
MDGLGKLKEKKKNGLIANRNLNLPACTCATACPCKLKAMDTKLFRSVVGKTRIDWGGGGGELSFKIYQ